MQTGLSWIDANAGELTALADTIWGYAEVGLREHKSSAALAAFLEHEGFTIQMGVAGMPTAFVASWGEGKPVIGYLGEYDALPGLSQKISGEKDPVVPGGAGHGCGHNLLGVGAAAAAVALKRELQAEGRPGTVRFYGCPAEETLIGKVFMAKHGLYDDLDAAITWHPMWMNAGWGGSSLAMNSVRFAFRGRTAHAAASPDMGISALDAVELMDVGVNFLREHVVQEARIHYVITKGGGEPNVVPALAEVWYYVRAPRRDDVEQIYQRILKIAEGACLMTGCTMEIKFQTGVYEYLPNPVLTGLLDDCLKRVGAPQWDEQDLALAHAIEGSYAPGQKTAVMRPAHVPRQYWDITLHDGVIPAFDTDKVMSGSTDVGDVSWIAPTGQITAATWVGGTAAHSWQATAASGSSIGHKGMLTAASAMALAGCELVGQPDLLAQAKAAFQEATGGKPYVSPLPSEMMEPAQQVGEH